MKKYVFVLGIVLISITLNGQSYRPLPAKLFPESDTSQKYYTLSGFRHGVSFFPKAKLAHVQYEAGDILTFDKYHSASVIYT